METMVSIQVDKRQVLEMIAQRKAEQRCPICGWGREAEDDPYFGYFERNGFTFTVCPNCGQNWPD